MIDKKIVKLKADYVSSNLLFGLEGLHEPYFLGNDPTGPSHEFTKLKAEEVAELLLPDAA